MKIAIVSPSAPSTHSQERTEQFEQGIKTLGELGFEVEVMPHAKDALGYISASTEDRLSDLHTAYSDPTIEAIVCANGGWNSSHLLQGLDIELIQNNPKPICGFSDITVLLNSVYKATGRVQLHSPMVTWGFYENDDTTNQSFLTALHGGVQECATSSFGKFIQGNNLEGVVIGGNLVTLGNLIGTIHEPEWEGKILVWEETAERTYNLDRELTRFKNIGVWDKIGGMVIGHLDQMKEKFGDRSFDPMEMIEEHFKDCEFPIFKTDLFGHGIKTNMTLPIGGKIVIDEDNVRIES